MGWFLTNATTKRPKRKPSKDRKPWDPQRTLQGLKVLAAVTCVVTLAAAWAWGEGHLRSYVAQRTARPILQDRVELAVSPGWMSPTLAAELRTAVAFELGEDPLDGIALQHAVKALSASPWVAHVDRIERLPGGKARVHAQYRRPVAVVETSRGYQLVDAEGVVLPQSYRLAELAAVGLKPIEGVTAPMPTPGRAWDDARLTAALSLIRLLEPQPWYTQITSIDAGGQDQRGRIRLVLHTDRGQVTWGLPPGHEQLVEPAPAVKLQRLTDMYANYRSIDAGGRVVDVFGAAAWGHTQP
jgi:hypothetical protein